MNMRILITGASGLLGRALMQEMKTSSTIEAVGCALSRASGDIRRVDLRSVPEIQRVIRDVKPACIIHAAAHRKPDVCDKDPAATMALNVEATANLARVAREEGSWVLYISSDYVFDGTRPPYRIDDRPNPVNLYGRSKLAGEVAVLQSDPRNCSLRIPILYGMVETLEESPVTTLVCDVAAGKPARTENWAIRYPTHVADVAAACRGLIERRAGDTSLTGIFHWSGDEALTKYQMSLIIADVLGCNGSHLTPASEPPDAGTPRPHNAHLDCSRLEDLGIGRRTPFRVGIAAALAGLGYPVARDAVGR